VKIAQVSPLYESVPPEKYGGTERVVSYLTEELVSQGHDVTLFASGDSITRAELIAGSPRSLRTDPKCHDPLAYHMIMLDEVVKRADDFDIIHFHTDYLHLLLSTRMATPSLTTLHGRLDLPELPAIYKQFRRAPLISISDSQRAPLPWANWVATVHHGLPLSLYSLVDAPESYLAFVGRISPEKGLERAIEIATRTGLPLRIAAKVDKVDQEYFESEIKQLLSNPLVEFNDEIGDNEKQEFIGKATALLFPIDWPEPFGLVMIEAMACGTPVIAFPGGSVREVVDDGVTGCVVESIEQAVDAVGNISSLDRARCRVVFETRFSASRMAQDYVRQFERLSKKRVENVPVEVRECL
jgi:glycosyltransferase involved in cell wall biosynthesis